MSDEGRVLSLTVEHVTYNVEPLSVLDENLRTCIPSHRDALLDARLARAGCDVTFSVMGRPAAFRWRCWTCEKESRLYDREQDAKASATRHKRRTT